MAIHPASSEDERHPEGTSPSGLVGVLHSQPHSKGQGPSELCRNRAPCSTQLFPNEAPSKLWHRDTLSLDTGDAETQHHAALGYELLFSFCGHRAYEQVCTFHKKPAIRSGI